MDAMFGVAPAARHRRAARAAAETEEKTMDPKTVVRDFWASYEKGDLETTWAQYVSSELVIHPSSGYEFTRESWLAAEQALFAAFTDVRVEVRDQVADGAKVATRWAVTGRQTGEFFGVPSSGRTATLTGTTVDVVRDGMIAEHWAEVGVPLFLQQLAAADSPDDDGAPAPSGRVGTLVGDAEHLTLERLATEVNWRVDNGVAETVAELFTPDGSIGTFGEPAVGTQAIRDWGRAMDRDRPLGNLRHVLSNFRFTADSPTEASGTFHVTAYVADGPQGNDTLPFAMGVCTDHYVRTQEGWRVRSRVFAPHALRQAA
jgi:predicted ester cyclase